MSARSAIILTRVCLPGSPKRCLSTAIHSDPLSGVEPTKLSYASFECTKTESTLPPLIINHGLFGSKGNWKSLSKAFVQKTGVKVYSVDSRNHGDSPHTKEMSVFHMAADLHQFHKDHTIEQSILMGHSLGGRAVMALALTRPEIIRKLIVVDISPAILPNTVNGEAKVALLAMEESLAHLSPEMTIAEARKVADKFMEQTIKARTKSTIRQNFGLRQFLLTNLRKGAENYEYQINLKTIRENLDKVLGMPALEGVYEGETLFIRGGLSGYIKRSDHPRIKKLFPRARIETIDDAAHWVHSDKPKEFLDLVSDFILKK